MLPFLFSVNPWSLFFTVLTVPPWIASLFFSFRYIEKSKCSYYFFFFLTFFANLLIFYAHNFFSILILFELISLASVPLVFYERTSEAIKAGKIYFFFSLLSGILVFSGVVILSGQPNSSLAYSLMCIGFLIKCGAYPFHVWLPVAHPVAPSPASAILSGCIIKVGFYGLFRVILTWNPNEEIGIILLILSLVTMLYGVIQALFQSNSKKMLAYHSVSQMGYILLGLSIYIMTKNSVPLTGSLMHAMNHAFFKSSLFLAIGILYLDSHTYDMYKMRGYFKKAPWISILFLVAILGITGTPFLNGFVSKTFIHEELLLEKQLLFKVAESIFLLTAIGTFVSNFKMFYLINIRPIPQCKRCKRYFREIFPLSLLALIILGFGLYPIIETKILPIHLLPHVAELLEEISPFHHLFLENLNGYLWIAISGISIIYVGLKWEWFHKKIPDVIDPLFIYEKFYHFFNIKMLPVLAFLEIKIVFFYSMIVKSMNYLIQADLYIENTLHKKYLAQYKRQIMLMVGQTKFEKKLNKAISFVILPENMNLTSKASISCERVESKINNNYQVVLQWIRFFFTVTNKQEIKSSKHYEALLDKKGKNIVIVLSVSIVVLTILFLILYRKFVS